jgi:DNA repair protein SbcC/Rad50
MIPVRLSLRNFMCYRENVPTLSFRGIHVACISGDNGNGKSALVDAMTWALWGKARAKSDTDLVAQGQPEMSVELDFNLGSQTYRIIRKFTKPRTYSGSGHSILEFQVAADAGFRSISGNTKELTQQKIEEVLHIDYETFINSAFLRQGHADEFTNKRPGERKQVLANILGLSQYDELEARAKLEANRWQGEVSSFQNTIRVLSEELAQKDACQAEYDASQTELAQLESAHADSEKKVEQLRGSFAALEARQAQRRQLEEQISEAKRSAGQWSAQILRHQARISEFENALSRREDIEEGYSRLIAARQSNDELNHKLGLLMIFGERKARLESEIDRCKNVLLRDQALSQHNILEFNRRIEKLPALKTELEQIEVDQLRLNELEVDLETKRSAARDFRIAVGKLEVEASQFKANIEDLSKKLNLFGGESGAACPLCEQELHDEDRHKITGKYRQELQEKTERVKTVLSEIIKQRSELTVLEKQTAQSEFKLKQDRAKNQGQAGALHKSIAEGMEIIENLAKEKERLSDIERRLAQNEFAAVEQKEAADIVSRIGDMGYDRAKHEETGRQLAALARFEEPKKKLDEAASLFESERESLARAENTLTGIANTLHNNDMLMESLARDLAEMPRVAGELSAVQSEFKGLSSRLTAIRGSAAAAREKLRHLSEVESNKLDKEKALAEAAGQMAIYKELAEAFGKNGVQATLIETALPEIEIEADRLLARMTDNRMHVKIETQREKKTGGVAETLDINVSDELGTRNYELFSGGEAFRINFAIRIALSRLLARRKGAPLPTLIIDEGFGTQDSTGIEKLKEAITSIQDDFEKILVITHIDDLKDAFPSRIEVVKTADGSTVAVN